MTTGNGDHTAAVTELRQQGTRIVFEQVLKSFGSTSVLHGIDLDVQPGEFIALLGPSGCGKTTLLRCLAGLEQPSGGRIQVGGDDIAHVPVNKRDMAVVFQAYSLFPHMTVAQNIGFGLEMRRVPKKERATRVAEALELVGLGATAQRYPHQLSGGQQQRVALARALVTRPRALLLDEPLSALDAKVRVRLRDEIKAIQSELGITTIFVTHDQHEALAVADRVAVMRDGRIEQIGSPEDLYQRPETSFVASFIGESNQLPGTVHGSEVEVFGTLLPILHSHAVDQDGVHTSTTDRQVVTVFVRPEQVQLQDKAHGEGTPVVVVSSGFYGAHRRTIVRTELGTLVTVQHEAGEHFRAEQVAMLNFHPAPVAIEARTES